MIQHNPDHHFVNYDETVNEQAYIFERNKLIKLANESVFPLPYFLGVFLPLPCKIGGKIKNQWVLHRVHVQYMKYG